MPDDRLTDSELESLLYYACSSGTGTPAWVRKKIEQVCIELAERRAADKPSDKILQTRLENQRHVFVQAKTHGGCEECGYPEHEELKHIPAKRGCYCNELGPLSLRSGDICGFCEKQAIARAISVPKEMLFGDLDNTETEEQRFSMDARLNRIGEEERLLEKDPTVGPALDVYACIPIETEEHMGCVEANANGDVFDPSAGPFIPGKVEATLQLERVDQSVNWAYSAFNGWWTCKRCKSFNTTDPDLPVAKKHLALCEDVARQYTQEKKTDGG